MNKDSPDANISTADSLSYWNNIAPNVDGMLGGYPQISRIDLKGSANFLAKLRREYPLKASTAPSKAVDCGAGIGRVTTGFLSTCCDVIDIVEPVEKFARELEGAVMAGKGRVGDVFVTGLQDWQPNGPYDLIWNQWCLGHLTDEQLVAYLMRCKRAVTTDGWIIVKENMSTDKDYEDIFDETDSSVTRTDAKFMRLFREVGLRLVKSEIQHGFPKGLFPVRIYALRP